jgi:hypothetical protein
MIPIPFLGWVDVEDTEQMLEIQQDIIKQLETKVARLEEECGFLIKQIGEVK